MELAKRGENICISSSNKLSLEKKAYEISAKIGKDIYYKVVDVSSYEQLSEAAVEIVQKYSKLERVIFMAGIYQPMETNYMKPLETSKIIEVNLIGAFNTVNAVIPFIKEKRLGQIAICGSLSGYIGLPNAQPYAATKAALINLAETMKVDLCDEIDVKLISPGFVSTRLTEKNSFDMPALMTTKKAAKIISDGLNSSKFEIHFPKRLSFTLKIISLLPYFLSNTILTKLKIK